MVELHKAAKCWVAWSAVVVALSASAVNAQQPKRTYENRLQRMEDPPPLLADYPQYVAPVQDLVRYEAPILVNDDGADMSVRAWRFSYNARGIIEMPNRLRAADTAVIMVHPWGIDDGQGWRTPEPAGVADFCTVEKNHLAGRHTREVIDPFLASLRGKVAFAVLTKPLKFTFIILCCTLGSSSSNLPKGIMAAQL